MTREYLWHIDECSNYTTRMWVRGWCYVPGATITGVSVVFPSDPEPVPLKSFGVVSPDVARAVSPAATHNRFEEWIPLTDKQRGHDFNLVIRLADGGTVTTTSAHQNCREGDPAHACWSRFLDMLGTFGCGDVLEIGSRARSGITRRHLIPKQLNYVGLDVMPGPNVDLVGDAHDLGQLLGTRRFKAVFSLSVFEHLAMPWKVAVEMSRVLETGGLAFVNTQQTWPLHEEPADYWRFSAYSWPHLFNRHTGYEIVHAAQGEPARVHPMWDSAVARDMPASYAYLSSSVIARKIGEPTVDWAVPAPTETVYPKGESQIG